jgi:hypothetical protein
MSKLVAAFNASNEQAMIQALLAGEAISVLPEEVRIALAVSLISLTKDEKIASNKQTLSVIYQALSTISLNDVKKAHIVLEKLN